MDRGRLSYVLWQEGRVPSVVVELLSPNTIEEDQGLTLRGRTPPLKWEVYERILRVPDYVLFNREANILQLFRLDGAHYRELNEERLWIEELGIGLGVWEGKFMEVERPWLRWYDAEGGWLPTEVERAVATERQRVEALAARLRALGVDPESL